MLRFFNEISFGGEDHSDEPVYIMLYILVRVWNFRKNLYILVLIYTGSVRQILVKNLTLYSIYWKFFQKNFALRADYFIVLLCLVNSPPQAWKFLVFHNRFALSKGVSEGNPYIQRSKFAKKNVCGGLKYIYNYILIPHCSPPRTSIYNIIYTGSKV